MAIKETQTSRAEAMEAHRQALIDAAIGHEQVIQFIEKLYEILARIGRKDVVVSTQARLENSGVLVKVAITYDIPKPGQQAYAPETNAILMQKERSLLGALREEKIKIGFGCVDYHALQTDYVVFQGIVSYQGEVLPV